MAPIIRQKRRQPVVGGIYKTIWLVALLLFAVHGKWTTQQVSAFLLPVATSTAGSSSSTGRERSAAKPFPFSSLHAAEMSVNEIKRELQNYLEARKQKNADALPAEQKGKTVGGTKGNKVLEYISGAPVKERVLEDEPNIFDYDQLTEYGYSKLVTPLMNLGGRSAAYDLMDIEPPVLKGPPPKLQAPKLIIDRKGETDKARYTGLKMGQVINDDAMAEALARANEKAKRGESLRPKLEEEYYVQPFADKRNVGPKQTPDWTPERLDEYTKAQGRAISWARRAKEGEFVKDPDEQWDLSLAFRTYGALLVLEIAAGFGRSTPSFMSDFLDMDERSIDVIQESLQAPGLALLLASFGSSIVCASVLAPGKNRGSGVWALKGLVGGPLAILQLRGLDPLVTRAEQSQRGKLERQS